MPKVIINDEQSIEQALQELRKKVYYEKSSRWYKRRYGYYEKPSVLKRKRRKMKRIVSQRDQQFDYVNECLFATRQNLWLKIGLQEQFARCGKNAVGK